MRSSFVSCFAFSFFFHCNDSDLTTGNLFFRFLQSFADMSDHSNLEVVEAVEEGVAEETTRASWEGSYVAIGDINWLIQTRRIPAEVECRLPGPETSPDLKKGEYVVFLEHFERGFGLPASDFFCSFLNKFGLQPHQLLANAFTTLSAFASFMEGYLGLWPTVEAWSKYFHFRKQVIPNPDHPDAPKEMTQCGAATIVPRRGSIFPRIQGLESCRKWQRSFFYVKNTTTVDMINLPRFSSAPQPHSSTGGTIRRIRIWWSTTSTRLSSSSETKE